MSPNERKTLERNILTFVAEKRRITNLPELLMTARQNQWVNGAPDRDIILTVHKLIDFNALAFTTDRRLKQGPSYETYRQNSLDKS